MDGFLKLTMEDGQVAYVHLPSLSAFGERAEGSWVEAGGAPPLTVRETVEEIAALIDSVRHRR